ncbi:hypothetical protein EV182_008479, partial [Spiromyces aspiralis]
MDVLVRDYGVRKVVSDEVVGIYRSILKESRQFFDPNVRQFINVYARMRFEQWRRLDHDGKKLRKLHTARKYLSLLRRANAGIRKPILKVL